MKTFLAAAIFFTFCSRVASQFSLPDSQLSGMGRVSATSIEISSLSGNQAGLTSLKSFSVIAGASQGFLLSELNTVFAGAALPTKSGTFGLSIQSFGFEEFKQYKAGLAYARKLWQSVSLGAQFDYFQTRIPEYGSKSVITFELGLQAALTKEFIIGTHVFSPVPVEWAENERLPAIFKMGLAYIPSGKASFALELEKDVDFPLRLKGGVEYRPVEALFLRAGFGNNPSMVHFGIGLAIGSALNVDLASSYHQTLGLSPSASVSYEKPNRK